MTFLAVLAAIALLVATPDVAPSGVKTQDAARNYDCSYLSVQATEQLLPGRIPLTPGRGEGVERNSLLCTELLIEHWRRRPQDEAVLRNLTLHSREVAEAATSTRPDLAERTWLVEAFHPSTVVTSKLVFAAKAALMEQGVAVSDRAPLLAVGDIDEIVRLPPTEAYREACRRYARTGSLRDTDALLAVVQVDPRETALHAGVCEDGNWSWLR